MNTHQKLILVTNDDSVNAKGIQSLVKMASALGTVIVVAPDKPQSGMGHAITLSSPIRLHRVHMFGEVEAYSSSGTPVDCVKLAIYEVLHRKPDLVLSGINHGENSSSNVLYSGTMSAAIEGAMEGIPSIGFSLSTYSDEADFMQYEGHVSHLIRSALEHDFPLHTCLNVNIPNLPAQEIKGIRLCTQAHAFWADRFDKREDQFGRPYYWLTGEFGEVNPREDSDLHALNEGFISVVPTQFDLTNYRVMEQLKSWNL
ncbi:MAG: 5'/3'-nucleotidase SurE [Flavobacteriales bacterium]